MSQSWIVVYQTGTDPIQTTLFKWETRPDSEQILANCPTIPRTAEILSCTLKRESVKTAFGVTPKRKATGKTAKQIGTEPTPTATRGMLSDRSTLTDWKQAASVASLGVTFQYTRTIPGRGLHIPDKRIVRVGVVTVNTFGEYSECRVGGELVRTFGMESAKRSVPVRPRTVQNPNKAPIVWNPPVRVPAPAPAPQSELPRILATKVVAKARKARKAK